MFFSSAIDEFDNVINVVNRVINVFYKCHGRV